ncbi:MAG: DUF1538 domain-containing protein [Ruminococcus sp.]|nr:DUF1538 domain-containing protein [Ruminococcus sp.]
MKKELLQKLRESLKAVIPVVAIVLILSMTIVDASAEFIIMFLIGAALLVSGMILFTLGADVSMMKMGQSVGSHITKSRKIPFIALICFILGVIATVAEPDLRVLADTVPMVDSTVLIASVAVGVGLFLVISFFRVYLQIKLNYIITVMYLLIFALALSPLIPNSFVAAAFDSGGVTTGPITVPFIMALGVGLASVRGDKTSQEDSFGLVALCSIGPVLTVLLLGAFSDTSAVTATSDPVPVYSSVREILSAYAKAFPDYFKEVASALLPIVAFFIIFQIFSLKLPKMEVIKISVGLVYTYVGLVLFLTGVNVGFMPMGTFIGQELGSGSYYWLLVPVCALIGYFIVAAEPAVHVLKQQVEDVTDGRISGKSMGFALGIGVAVSVGLAMVRVITGISIWYILIPAYLFSIIMTFFVPPIFTAIAFDSGGVASGPMTATFLLPLAIGACEARGGSILTDAFGLVAFVAAAPLVTIQLMGLISKIKSAGRAKTPVVADIPLSDEIVEFDVYEEGILNE